MYLPKTNLYTPSDSWDEEVESWATTIRKVPVRASCSWTTSGPLKKHFMATYNSCSAMWASSATALHTAEPPPQQECHRQSEGRITVPPSVLLALLRVSQILLLSSPCNLPNQHILQTLRNHPTSQPLTQIHWNYTAQQKVLWELFQPIIGLRVFALKRTVCEMPSVQQGSGAFAAIFCRAWGRSQYCTNPKS